VKFEFINMRSEPIATALRESKIDFGVVRPNALGHPIKHTPVDSVGYLLFAPSGVELDKALKLPLALSNNSEFKQSIEDNAAKAKVKLNSVFTCSSFYQCEILLRRGVAVTILPSNMKDRLKEFSSHEPKWIQKYQRKISVAWRVGMLGSKGRLADEVKEALVGK
jgi:DNA-binding transcriptional LysR family regulator